MKPDILLTHGYFLAEDPKEQQIMKPYAPLGLMYLSAYLKQQGITVELFDSTFAFRQDLYDRLSLAGRSKILGIYTNLMTRPSIIDITREAKIQGWTVILGGPESANYPEEYLQAGADFVVIGEGEQTLQALVEALTGEDHPYDIDGIAYLDQQNNLIQNAPRSLPKDIDQYPWPDRDAIDLKRYFHAWRTHHGKSSVSMITARGCPYKCTWCSHAVFGYSHRRRDPIDCANELEHIVNTYNPEEIWYADDVFTINHKWLFRYANELDKRQLKLPFETISRADRMLDDRVMDTLQAMGCYRIWIGAESGSQRLLDQMKRGVTMDQVYQATKAAQKRGIQVGMFLMWGFGDENLDDIDETVTQVAHVNPDIFFTTVAYPIKGTEFYLENEQAMSLDKPWEIASDRDITLQSRKSDRYYRLANKYLYAHVDATRMEKRGDRLASLRKKHATRARALLELEAHG
ncbi:Anaerobic magnesium-protoporphyrin IX monomethyl ester cyclase [BD1-7 clade bacterium]|uniref:Anaerobic magnesium-protoporphyrin IX monomethyl ester cyclase n=1 Tax=BD1-7 clade bacterium TaxID=2029982 RepID=A0A5S9PCM3_9GAMM|nr:Anaerobic magnesium-protoporphyrin IX monomethyl ester cyclase [BD1-7 clade bacterium]